MLRLLFTLLCFCLPYSIEAQLPSNTVAKDFTITDLEGKKHHLYNYLDDGKIVLVDIFSTWCPPCWEYVNSGVLQKMHKKYGKKNVVVLLIEGDRMTSDDCIIAGPDCKEIMTRGNWEEVVNFPIAGDVGPDIAKLYGVQYYPTVLMFFPNRLVEEVGQIPFKDLIEIKKKNKHNKVSKANNVACVASSLEDLNCKMLNPTFKFQNLGTENLKQFEVDMYVNGKIIETKSWKGNAKTYEIIDINMSPFSLIDKNELTLKARLPNGEKDRKKKNNSYAKTLWIPTLKKTGTLKFRIQNIGKNNSVDIKIIDATGKTIFELTDQQDQEDELIVDVNAINLDGEGCYNLVLEDAYNRDKTYNENLSVTIINEHFTYKTSRKQFEKVGRGVLQLKIPFYKTY